MMWIRIRIPGSMPLTNGSGFSDPPDPAIFATEFLLITYFLKVHLHNFSDIRSQKKVTKAVGIKVFLTIVA
jgi:hypothetical protein